MRFPFENLAALIIAHKCVMTANAIGNINHERAQNMLAKTKNNIAGIIRPCTNCPNPGIKKLHIAAKTFPPEPCCAIKIS